MSLVFFTNRIMTIVIFLLLFGPPLDSVLLIRTEPVVESVQIELDLVKPLRLCGHVSLESVDVLRQARFW